MTTDPSEKLRELALSITRGNLRRPWSIQTSNSFRRLGTDRGDGDVLCAVTQPPDGHPDLRAAPDVLDYIVAAHPFAILQLIRERASARHALHLLRHKIAGHNQVFREAGGLTGIYLSRTNMGADQIPTDQAASIVRAIIADLTDRGGLRQAWEEIDAGIRREIVASWEKIARVQIAEVGEVPEVPKAQLPSDAGDPAGDATTEHPPIASYVLGQSVTFHPGLGDHWHSGIVTRLESGLRTDGSAWHVIFVSSTRDLPRGAYRFEDRNNDDARVRPARDNAMTGCPKCQNVSVRAKELHEGGGECCITPGCDYWFCF